MQRYPQFPEIHQNKQKSICLNDFHPYSDICIESERTEYFVMQCVRGFLIGCYEIHQGTGQGKFQILTN